MKIAFLSFYSGEVYRGVETYVHELSNRLVGLGHDITVYQNGPKLKDSNYKTVTIGLKIDWSAKSFGFPFINYWSLLVKKFTQESLKRMDKGTDAIIAGNGQWGSLLCKLWALKNHKKLVISGQSGVGLEDRFNLYLFPDAFVPISTRALKASRLRNPFVKSVYIPNGVDLSKFKPEGITHNIKLPRPIILIVGALFPYKRIDLAIKAVSRLGGASLLVIGKGPEHDRLLDLGSKLLGERFTILDLPFEDMPEIYRSADLFTLPSVAHQSFEIVLVEAMASGLGVVANNDPIRREIVGDAGLFVDPNDTEAYALALKKALAIKWGSKPRNQAGRFSWDDIATKYEKLFKELI